MERHTTQILTFQFSTIKQGGETMAKALLNKILSTSGFISLIMTVGFVILTATGKMTDSYTTLYTVIITFYFSNDMAPTERKEIKKNEQSVL